MIHPAGIPPQSCDPIRGGKHTLASSASWIIIQVILAITTSDAEAIERTAGIAFRPEDMLRPGVFVMYLQSDQIAYLRNLSSLNLFTPSTDSKFRASGLQYHLFQPARYWVKAGSDWVPPESATVRKIGAQLFEVQTKDATALVADPAVLVVIDPPQYRLLNRYTAGFLRGGSQDVTWLRTENPSTFTTGRLKKHGVIERDWEQIDGNGQIVSVTDSGLYMMHPFFHDQVWATPCPAHRKVVEYYEADSADTSDQHSGHGTHVCGTIAGSLDCTYEIGGKSVCQYKFSRFEGIAPGAKLHFQDIGVASGDEVKLVSTDAEKLADNLLGHNARISSNSWGSEVSPEGTFQYTEAAFKHPQLLYVFAVGNDGETICSPGDSKNVAAVGAVTNPVSFSISSFLTDTYIEQFGDTEPYRVDICEHSTGTCERGYDAVGAGNGSVWKSDWDDSVPYFWGKPISEQKGTNAIYMTRSEVSEDMVVSIMGEVAGIIYISEGRRPYTERTKPIIRVSEAQYDKILTWAAVDLFPAPRESKDPWKIERAYFSGRGPTPLGLDGPLVVAPGNWSIISAMGENSSSTTQATDFKLALAAKAGTSMATPAIAGLLALYRQYLAEKRGISEPTSYLMRAILVASARPVQGVEVVDTDTGYGVPQLTRLEFVTFRDGLTIGSGQHLVFDINVQPLQPEVHVVMSYLDPPLSADALYPFFADLDLAVVGLGSTVRRGNGLGEHYDAFTTNEKVILKSAQGPFKIHVLASTFALSNPPNVKFALAVSTTFEKVEITGQTVTTECIDGQGNAQCQGGRLVCPEGRAGTRCEEAVVEWEMEKQLSLKLSRKQVKFVRFTRPDPGDASGIQFTADSNATRGVTVCIAEAPFKQLADPGSACTTSVYGRDGIYDPLFLKMDDKTADKKFWGALYCVSNGPCTGTISWKNGERTIFGLPVGAIIGIVLGGIAVVAAGLAAYCYCFKKGKVANA